jgi:hypothetical protein
MVKNGKNMNFSQQKMYKDIETAQFCHKPKQYKIVFEKKLTVISRLTSCWM